MKGKQQLSNPNWREYPKLDTKINTFSISVGCDYIQQVPIFLFPTSIDLLDQLVKKHYMFHGTPRIITPYA